MTEDTGIYMYIAAVLAGPDSKSFEEVRINDYVKAYQTTGRPPLPCPQEPTDESQRKALNLPPLFKPYIPSASSSSLPKQPTIDNPDNIPPAQEFRALKAEVDIYHTMSCMNEYRNFSHEELRYYAYLRGHVKPPVPVAMDPFVQFQIPPLVVAPLGEEKLQSICAEPEYDKHSPEELRVAYLLHRRQLTSAEILQLQNPTASTISPPVASMPSNSLISSIPTTIPPPIFAAPPAATSTSKFTFGLR